MSAILGADEDGKFAMSNPMMQGKRSPRAGALGARSGGTPLSPLHETDAKEAPSAYDGRRHTDPESRERSSSMPRPAVRRGRRGNAHGPGQLKTGAWRRFSRSARASISAAQFGERLSQLRLASMVRRWSSKAENVGSVAHRVRFDRESRWRNCRMAVVASLSIILMMWDEESRWHTGPEYEHGVFNDASLHAFAWFDIAIPATNAVLVALLIDYYRHKAENFKQQWGLESRWAAFWASEQRYLFLAELLMCLVQPTPRIVYQQKFNGDSWIRFLGLAMFLRLYILLRVFRDFSHVYIHRHRALAMYNGGTVRSGTMLAVRVAVLERPIMIVTGSIALVMLLFTYVLYAMEREARFEGFDVSINSIAKAMWFAFATLTTIGYGDTAPSRTNAYWPSIAEGFLGMVVTSLLVAVVMNHLELRGSDAALYTWHQSEKTQRQKKALSSKLISIVVQNWYRRTHREKIAEDLASRHESREEARAQMSKRSSSRGSILRATNALRSEDVADRISLYKQSKPILSKIRGLRRIQELNKSSQYAMMVGLREEQREMARQRAQDHGALCGIVKELAVAVASLHEDVQSLREDVHTRLLPNVAAATNGGDGAAVSAAGGSAAAAGAGAGSGVGAGIGFGGRASGGDDDPMGTIGSGDEASGDGGDGDGDGHGGSVREIASDGETDDSHGARGAGAGGVDRASATASPAATGPAQPRSSRTGHRPSVDDISEVAI